MAYAVLRGPHRKLLVSSETYLLLVHGWRSRVCITLFKILNKENCTSSFKNHPRTAKTTFRVTQKYGPPIIILVNDTTLKTIKQLLTYLRVRESTIGYSYRLHLLMMYRVKTMQHHSARQRPSPHITLHTRAIQTDKLHTVLLLFITFSRSAESEKIVAPQTEHVTLV